MVQQKIYRMESCIKIEKWRSIVIIFYKLHIFDLEKSLWNHYLKADTGALRSDESTLTIWSDNVQTRIELGPLLTTNSDSNQIELNENYS
jgi:hypothetical protein